MTALKKFSGSVNQHVEVRSGLAWSTVSQQGGSKGYGEVPAIEITVSAKASSPFSSVFVLSPDAAITLVAQLNEAIRNLT